MGALILTALSGVWSLLKTYWKPLAQMVGGFFVGRKSVQTADLKADLKASKAMQKAAAQAPSNVSDLKDTLDKGDF